MEEGRTSENQPYLTELDTTKIVLLRLYEEGIITDFQKKQIESKSELSYQKLDVYELMRSLEWKSSVRILQLIKYIQSDQSNLMTTERNPLQIHPIIKQVFGLIPPGALMDLRLVCKSWNDVADPLIKKNAMATFSGFSSRKRNVVPIHEFLSTFQESKYQITKFHFMSDSLLVADLEKFFSQQGRYITEICFNDCDLIAQGEKLQSYDITSWLANCPQIEELVIINDIENTRLMISLDVIPNIKILRLSNCSINIRNDFKISPVEFLFGDVMFKRNGLDFQEFCINDAITFTDVESAEIDCSGTNCKAILDISTSTNTEIITLYILVLMGVRVKSWREGNWVIKTLFLKDVNFLERTKADIANISFTGTSSVDLSVLPLTIENLVFSDPKATISCSQPIILPKLKVLSLQGNTAAISHFTNCSNLVDLEMKCYRDIDETVNFNDIPRTIQKMKLCGIAMAGTDENPMQLLKLIMEDYSFADAFYMTKLFQPELTVLKWDCKDTFEVPESFVKFMLNLSLKVFVVGTFRSIKESSTLRQYVDASANNYIFRGRRGNAIGDYEFMQFMIFPHDHFLRQPVSSPFE